MKSIALIVNKKAFKASLIDDYLKAFDKEGISYSFFEMEPEKLEEKIKQCLKTCDLLLVGGGDGTIRSAAQWCANKAITLGVLPLGTMNHFVKEVGLPLTIQELIDAIKKPNIIKIDLAEVNGNIFLNNSSIGFYPKLAKKRDYYAKLYHKWLSYIPSLIKTFSSHETFNISIQSPESNFCLDTSFLMVSNNLYSYQFPTRIGRENFNKNILGIYFLKHGKMSISKILDHLFSKRNHFERRTSQGPLEVDITNKDKIAISLDGDTMTVQTPLIYRSLPNSLQVLTLS